MEYFELSLLTVSGLIIGSFVNVCVDRLTFKFSKTESRLNLLNSYEIPIFLKEHIINRTLNLFHPARSFCFTCGHQLNWFENIPVLSYFLCRGICRRCKAFIGKKTILTEISHGFFFLGAGLFLDNWINVFFLSICFSFFWFFVSFCYFSRNLEKIIFREFK